MLQGCLKFEKEKIHKHRSFEGIQVEHFQKKISSSWFSRNGTQSYIQGNNMLKGSRVQEK